MPTPRLWLSKRMVAKSRARRTSRRKSRRRTRLPHDMIDQLRVPVARGTLEAADQVGRTRDAFETCCERTFRWGQHGHAQPHGMRRAMRMAHAGCRINVGMRLREASERGDRRRAVSSRCGTWAPGPVCVWIADDADGSGSARQDQSSKLEITRLRERGKRGFDSSRRNRNKTLDAPYIACNANFNIQPNFRQELEQKLMAPADHPGA